MRIVIYFTKGERRELDHDADVRVTEGGALSVTQFDESGCLRHHDLWAPHAWLRVERVWAEQVDR